jgi:hypothetical protein
MKIETGGADAGLDVPTCENCVGLGGFDLLGEALTIKGQ